MNSQINLSSKKSNFTISNILKASNDKKNSSSRSNTQEIPHYNPSKNKSSSCNYRKNKYENSSLYNYKNEEFPKKSSVAKVNISTKINSVANSNINKNEYQNLNIYQFKEILNQKDKMIGDLEKQIKMYQEKLKNQIRVFNINTSISKTRSSTNITERNMNQIRSLSNSQAKIKTSYPLTRNLYGNKNVDNKMNNIKNKNKSKSKKRPKSNNYKKPKIDNYFLGNKELDNQKHMNNFKRNENNSKQKYKNKFQVNIMNYKRAKSSNVEKNKKINNLIKPNKSNTKNVNKDEKLLTIEETQKLCDIMMEKMRYVLELVKLATTGE